MAPPSRLPRLPARDARARRASRLSRIVLLPARGALALLALALSCEGGALALDPVEDLLNPMLEDYRTLEPAAEGFFVEGGKAAIGSLELDLHQGGLYPLRTQGGAVLGFYFEGQGSYRYRVRGDAERGIFAANLAQEGLGAVHDAGAARDEFDRVVLLFTAPAFQDLWKPGAAGARPARPLPAEERSALDNIWKRVLTTDLGHDHLAAAAAANGDGRQYVFAEIAGRKGTVGYIHDAVRERRERLVSFRKLQGYAARFVVTLGEQAVEEAAAAPAVVLTHAEFEIATPDNRRGTIMSDLTFEVGRDGLRVPTFYLMNNRNPNDVDWTSPKNRLTVVRILDAAGRELPFSHRYRELLVQLAEPARRGEPLRLRFETEGEVFTTRLGETKDNYFELMFDSWFPEPPGGFGSSFTFHITVRTRKPFRPVAPGTVVRSVEEGDDYVLETRSDVPTRLVGVFAGKYRVTEQVFGDRTIRVHAYATAQKDAAAIILGLSDYFLSYYEHHLGPYPFRELNVVEIPLWGFGIAPAGLVLITSEAYKPHAELQLGISPGSRGINARLAHEIAHQWFPHKAKLASPEDVWLSESVAEYLSGLAMAAAQAGGEGQVMGFRQMHEEWWAEAKYVADLGPLTASEKISMDDADGFRKRYGLLYCRGPLVLHMLRTYIGDQAFFAVLRRYLDNAAMGYAGTDDFERAAEEVLQTDVGWFLDQWVRQGGIPEVKVETRIETAEDGSPRLRGRAEQAAAGFKRIYIPVVLDYGDGSREAKFLDMDQPVKEFHYTLARPPKKVSIDPAHNNLVLYR
jgi:hypothetical protein